jgi:hypothetical protein
MKGRTSTPAGTLTLMSHWNSKRNATADVGISGTHEYLEHPRRDGHLS